MTGSDYNTKSTKIFMGSGCSITHRTPNSLLKLSVSPRFEFDKHTSLQECIINYGCKKFSLTMTNALAYNNTVLSTGTVFTTLHFLPNL